MKKNSTDNLLTLNFGRMCIANFLLFASVYLFLPLLPRWAGTSFPTVETGYYYLAFLAGMLVIGPFHAYLGDAYKRKSVLGWSLVIMAGATIGYLFVDSWLKMMGLAVIHGIGFGGAVAASVTVAIDVTVSTRRSDGNNVFAVMGRLGMLVGVCAGLWLAPRYEFRLLAYVTVGLLLLTLYLTSRVYVAFRAPIGMSVCNLDRFILPRAWLPALNVFILSWVPGVLLAASKGWGSWNAVIGFVILALLAMPFTVTFVKLSQHCQRGTANVFCKLATDMGILLGLCTGFVSEQLSQTAVYVGFAGLLALGLLTYPYYRKMRMR